MLKLHGQINIKAFLVLKNSARSISG